jgi:hypothetical protein
MTIDAKRDWPISELASSPAGKDLRHRTSASRTRKPPRCGRMNLKERRPAPADDGGRTRRGALSLAFSRGGRASTNG